MLVRVALQKELIVHADKFKLASDLWHERSSRSSSSASSAVKLMMQPQDPPRTTQRSFEPAHHQVRSTDECNTVPTDWNT